MMDEITHLHNWHVIEWLNETRAEGFSRFESVYHTKFESMQVRATPWGFHFDSIRLDTVFERPSIKPHQLEIDFSGVMGVPPKEKYGRPVS